MQQENGLAPPPLNDMEREPIRLDAPAQPRGLVGHLPDSFWI
jgi:hypothetical protein